MVIKSVLLDDEKQEKLKITRSKNLVYYYIKHRTVDPKINVVGLFNIGLAGVHLEERILITVTLLSLAKTTFALLKVNCSIV